MSYPPVTQTKTFTVTNTKLMVATAALAFASGLSFMLAPQMDFDFSNSSATDSSQNTTEVAYAPTGAEYQEASGEAGEQNASGEPGSPDPGASISPDQAPQIQPVQFDLLCSDTDGGNAPNTFGIVSLKTKNGIELATEKDVCIDPKTVKEYFCDSAPGADPQSFVFQNEACDDGYRCANGECKQAPRLIAGVHFSTPATNNYVMGSVGIPIAKFFLETTSTLENVTVTQLVASFDVSLGAAAFLKNIRLIDNDTGKQLGQTIAAPSTVVNGKNAGFKNYTHAVFTGLNLTITPSPKNVVKILTVMADFATYDGAGANATGQTISPALLTTFSGNEADVSVTGVGVTSGLPAFTIISSNHQDGARAKELTLYRAKLTAAWAADTPVGPNSPSAAQLVAKFVLTNLANAGTYAATVQTINLGFLDSNVPATLSRLLSIYKDSLATTELARFSYLAGQRFFGDSAITDVNFTDVAISSGSSKTFYATLDTSDFGANQTLSARVPEKGVEWSDGVTRNIFMMGGALPLDFKTFNY